MKKLLVFSILLLTSHALFSQVKTNFTQQDYSKFFIEGCIPKDLTSDNHVLLVRTPFDESNTEKNNEIDEAFKTYYKFPYILVPADFKDTKKTYDSFQVYKYSISFLKTTAKYGDPNDKMDTRHTHYELSIIDRLKTSKNTLPVMPEGLSKKEKEKFYNEVRKNMDNYKVDLTAVRKTGLEDNQSKIKEMVTFLAKKLGNNKE